MSHSFYGSEVWMCVSWVLCSGSYQATVKVSAGSGVFSETEVPPWSSLTVGRVSFLRLWGLSLSCHQLLAADPLSVWTLLSGLCHRALSFHSTAVCFTAASAAAKSLQSCLTLCDPIDGSPPGSPVFGILQARTLEWAAISFSNVWKWKVKVKSLSHVWPSATPWTAAYQAPPSMGVSRQEYWSRVPSPSPVCFTSAAISSLMSHPLSSISADWGRLTWDNSPFD